MRTSCHAAVAAACFLVAAQAEMTATAHVPAITATAQVPAVPVTLLTITRAPHRYRPTVIRTEIVKTVTIDNYPLGREKYWPFGPEIPLDACNFRPGQNPYKCGRDAQTEEPVSVPALGEKVQSSAQRGPSPSPTPAAGDKDSEAPSCAWKPDQKSSDDCGCSGELSESDFGSDTDA